MKAPKPQQHHRWITYPFSAHGIENQVLVTVGSPHSNSVPDEGWATQLGQTRVKHTLCDLGGDLT